MTSNQKKRKKSPHNPTKKFEATLSADQKKTEKKIANRKVKDRFKEPLLPGSWKIHAPIFIMAVILTLVLYSGDLHLGFFSVDDPGYVTDNIWIRSISSENIGHILSTPYFANYSPVHLFSYMIDYAFAGANAYTFHLSSNLWAGIVAGFVYLVALALSKRQFVAIASTVLFIVHPSHVEAVAWISSRKDLVAAAFALPSFLAYLQYRRNPEVSRRWYIVSLLLFLFAVGGKLSVAILPGIFFIHDLFVEKRPLARSIIDKIPFLAVAIIIAALAASAQPSMGNKPDPYVLTAALVQNFWLLTGFGHYVLYRMPPETTQIVLKIGAVIIFLAIFLLPLLLRRRFPVFVVLIYWILFSFIPTQVLSFTHPVTDRYLFFPSIAAVILIAWIIAMATDRISKYKVVIASTIALFLTTIWVRNTLNYISEWKDPRSVWFAASKKSGDPVVPQNLGTHYLDWARAMNQGIKKQVSEKDKKFASAIWTGDKRLPRLLSEWERGQRAGPMEKLFIEHILTDALQAFELSQKNKSDRVMPGLYYNRGLLFLEQGKLDDAKKEFMIGLSEAGRESFAPVAQQLTVYFHTNLGIIAWKKNNYKEALDWFRKAEEEQIRFGGNWIPNLTANRKTLESIVASQPSK